MKPMTTEEEYRNASVPMPKGTNDLEEIIRVLETRNEYLHKHIEKLTEEVHMLREDNVMLAKQIDDKVRKMRESGLI
jgi:predicted RNase H-like nuclease (RuvC/YqgF family)